jgi:glycosyltransferase involved in cell wall biosynthesis
MTRGLVSVIIPAFNAAEYIRQTLHSVLAQTYQSLEVIVVDDGSEDGTDAIVEEFVKKDTRVQLVPQCNAGVGAARNTGIRMARGEYIAPLDADDIWFPEKLEKQVVCMEQNGEETGMIYCWSTRVDKDGKFEGTSYPTKAGGRVLQAMVLQNLVNNASMPLLRAVALARVGLYLTRAEQGGAQGCEDWDLHIRIAETYNIHLVPEFLMAYRGTGCSMRVNVESMAASFAVVIERARQRNPDLPPATFRASSGDFYVYLVHTCDRWANHSASCRYLKQAVCANPRYLLKSWILKRFIKSHLKTITTSARKMLIKQVQLTSGRKRQVAKLYYDRVEPSGLQALRGWD